MLNTKATAAKVAAALKAEGYAASGIEVSELFDGNGTATGEYMVLVTIEGGEQTELRDIITEIASEALLNEHAAATEAGGTLYVDATGERA